MTAQQELYTLNPDALIELFELDLIGDYLPTKNRTTLDHINIAEINPRLDTSLTENAYNTVLYEEIENGNAGVLRWCNYEQAGNNILRLSGPATHPVTYPNSAFRAIRGIWVKDLDDPNPVIQSKVNKIFAHPYTPWPIAKSGFKKESGGTLPEVSIEIADFDSTITAFLENFEPYNGKLVRRRILAKYLDGGSSPNWRAQYDPDVFYLNAWDTDLNITLKFVSPLARLNSYIPKRRIAAL